MEYNEKTGSKKGLTLIEVILSAALSFLVGVIIYAAFNNGLKIMKRINLNRNHEYKLMLIFEDLTKELRNTFEISNIAFEGTGDTLSFPNIVEVNLADDILRPEPGRVKYFLNEENVFCKQQQAYWEIFREKEEEEGSESKELLWDVSKITFSYCYLDNTIGEYKWKEDWLKEEQESIPQAVRVKVVIKEISGEEKEFVKTVFIPIGTGEQKIVIGK